MTIDISEENLKEGLLGLVVALVEILQEVIERQALRRIEGGRLDDEEVDRLGEALYDLEVTLDKIKVENGIEDAVRSVRDGLDKVADDLLDQLMDPEIFYEER